MMPHPFVNGKSLSECNIFDSDLNRDFFSLVVTSAFNFKTEKVLLGLHKTLPPAHFVIDLTHLDHLLSLGIQDHNYIAHQDMKIEATLDLT